MTRTIYMEVSCPDCGYHGPMDGRTWSPKTNRCPKCQLGTLIRGETVLQRGTTLEKAMAEQPEPIVEIVAKSLAELPKELPKEPVAKRYIVSGRGDVEKYAREGKGLEEITKLLEGKLAPLTVKAYYYAVKAPERTEIKQKAELPITKMGKPKRGKYLPCAGCGTEIYIQPWRLVGKPKDYPFRCGKCRISGEKAKAIKTGKPGPAGLPPLPEWDNKWPAPVKVEWLKVYRILISKRK